jgi:vacuolar-type H+-ATPase subunit I/STV1
MMMQAKRLIHEYRFDKPTHHVALVHKNQGGAANGYKEALVLKSTNDIQDEDIEKATMVKVTLPFEDFLEKFFGMWSEHAEVLTSILGFDLEEDDMDENMSWEQYKAKEEEEKQKFIESVEILKSVKEGDVSIGDLSAKSFLSVLQAQEKFEAYLQKAKETPVNTVELQKAKQDLADVTAKVAELQKAKDAVAQELQAALAEVQKAKELNDSLIAEKQKAKDEARLQQLEAVKSKDEAAELFKSLNSLDDVAFATVMKSLNAASVLEAEAFKEKGVSGGADDSTDLVAKMLANKYKVQ